MYVFLSMALSALFSADHFKCSSRDFCLLYLFLYLISFSLSITSCFREIDKKSFLKIKSFNLLCYNGVSVLSKEYSNIFANYLFFFFLSITGLSYIILVLKMDNKSNVTALINSFLICT